MKKEIGSVISQNHNAIIILMSDHGPYLFFKNEEECQKREIYTLFRDVYGAFLAIRWPDKEKASKYDKNFNVIQDLFPIIFAYLYDDHSLLKHKIKDTSVRLKDHRFDKGIAYPQIIIRKMKKSLVGIRIRELQ
jgi:arylsulfatase A-like enzyme